MFYDHPVFPDNISFRRAVCKEQTLGKYKQCLFSYSYIRRDIIFLTFPFSPWFCSNIFQRSVSCPPLSSRHF